jgi:sulfatase maturation enzyme AslB (radical SAM superfamily)
MKTAVEWLIEKMKTYNMTVSVHNTSHENVMDFYKAIEQAKEMELDNIKQAYNDGKRDAYRQDDVPTADEYVYQRYGHEKL